MKFMMQDNIMVKGLPCTAGSRMLEGFAAPFSATVYEKCVAAGLEFAGHVVGDELGIARLFDHSQKEETDPAVTAILERRCDAVLCNDIFGKLRRQGPQNGLTYVHPAYGTVSRYGLVATVSSMDQIGVLCRTVEDAAAVLNVISGHDPRDGTTLLPNAGPLQETTVAGSEFCSNMHPSLPFSVFYILAAAEICNNTTRFDGVKFGYHAEAKGLEEVYVRSRSEGMGRDLQLASLVGCMVLSKTHYNGLYDKAMRVRCMLKDSYNALLDENNMDALGALGFFAIPALCGLAAISMPGKNVGAQLVCRHGQENAMFARAKELI